MQGKTEYLFDDVLTNICSRFIIVASGENNRSIIRGTLFMKTTHWEFDDFGAYEEELEEDCGTGFFMLPSGSPAGESTRSGIREAS